MLRTPVTTLKLTSDDVGELIAELEEKKLQQIITTQRKNVLRTSTRVDGGAGTVQLQENERPTKPNNADDSLDEPIQVDSFIHESPLDNKNNTRSEHYQRGLGISLDDIGPIAASEQARPSAPPVQQNPTNFTNESNQSNPFYQA